MVLAITSFLFIIMASVTGVVLAVKPIHQQVSTTTVPDAEGVLVTQTIRALQEKYLEVLEVKVTPTKLVEASVINDDGDAITMYINPVTGERVSDVWEESEVYSFAKTLHRSLFLKGLGRIFVAITSLLLLLLTITGFWLVLKRQQGIKKLLSKIKKDNFYQLAHTYLGRLFSVPIVVITLSGIYLALFSLQLIDHAKPLHNIDFDLIEEAPAREIANFPALQNIYMSDVKAIEFPFSPDVEDYFTIYLEDREICVNQVTGTLLSEVRYPFTEIAYRWGFVLHTGESSAVWAFVLLLACIVIVFFVFSGFKLTFKRKASALKNTYKAAEATHVIVVGSENGTTLSFAVWLQKQFIAQRKKVFVAHMNHYKTFPAMEELLVLTATYGKGEAPANANKFAALLAKTVQPDFVFSVVGFGSTAYPDFGKYAQDVHELLTNTKGATAKLPLHTVNNKSVEMFNHWVKAYSTASKLLLSLCSRTDLHLSSGKKAAYKVISKTELVAVNQSFLLEVAPVKKEKYVSGDLIAIAPDAESYDRLYSVGVTKNNTLLLSIKLHNQGVCTNYLYDLLPGTEFLAHREKNKTFYLPAKAKQVVMVATGTGIAPFLGMIAHNATGKAVHLFWGARNITTFQPYEQHVSEALQSGKLKQFVPVYSGEGGAKKYVQHQLQQEQDLVVSTLTNGGAIMLCGSVAMQQEVVQILDTMVQQHLNKPISFFENKGQLLMDCY